MSGDTTTLPLSLLQRALKSFKLVAGEQCKNINHINVFRLFTATLNGALDNNEPVFQPIVNENGDIIANESLSRLVDKDGKSHKIQDMANAAYEAGRHAEFDRITCITGLEKALEQDCFPVTLNASPTALLEDGFIEEIFIHATVLGIAPKDFIFEILEHDVNPKANIEHLLKLKEQEGIRFWLDDFGKGQKHQNVLDAFAELVEGIKVDGKYVCGYLKQEGFKMSEDESCMDGLPEILGDIYNHYGHSDKMPLLIAECVHTPEEMTALKELGFGGFQGQELSDELALFATQRATCQVPPHM